MASDAFALRAHAFGLGRIDGTRPADSLGDARTEARLVGVDPRAVPAPNLAPLQDAEDSRPGARGLVGVP